jgi:hypothetical protein
MRMNQVSVLSLPEKWQTQIEDGSNGNSEEPIIFDLLEAEAAAIEICTWPNDRNVRKLAGRIITICTGEQFAEVRNCASRILMLRDSEARASLAEKIVEYLKPYTKVKEVQPKTVGI